LKNDIIAEKIRDILIGSLLGDSSGEMIKAAKNPCFAFKQWVKHIDYILYIYFILLYWGYVQPFAFPKVKWTKDSKGNKHKYVRFRMITSPNLLEIYNLFYKVNNGKRRKKVPNNIDLYLTPRALAFWIMDDGSKEEHGILLHTNSFTYEEILLLVKVLKNKYNIDSWPRKKYDKYIIYISSKSVSLVVKLVKMYMHPKFYYKLGIN
jgi:ubiquinol-cytochrome c reductase cytochrome b subunit